MYNEGHFVDIASELLSFKGEHTKETPEQIALTFY